MGIRPNHCQFWGAPRMTLPHHHHLDPQYIRTTQLHLHHPHHYLDYTVLPPPSPLVQSAPQVGAFVLHGQTETMPHSVVTPAPIIDDTQAHIDRIKQRIRSLHVSDGVIGWDGYDDLPVAALPVEFRMPDIERYTGIGCPRIHL